MKRLLLVLLLTSGCASNETKATNYCNQTDWQAQYSSWQECYNSELPRQNRARKAFGAVLSGAGQGLQNAQNNTFHCTTLGNQTTCH